MLLDVLSQGAREVRIVEQRSCPPYQVAYVSKPNQEPVLAVSDVIPGCHRPCGYDRLAASESTTQEGEAEVAWSSERVRTANLDWPSSLVNSAEERS